MGGPERRQRAFGKESSLSISMSRACRLAERSLAGIHTKVDKCRALRVRRLAKKLDREGVDKARLIPVVGGGEGRLIVYGRPMSD